jgi:hypothetical protein
MQIDAATSALSNNARHAGARPFGFHAPPWAEYVGCDFDGMVWAFQHCPVADPHMRSWTSGPITGRYALLGSCRQEMPNWQEVILRRHGGLWRSLRAELEEERDADFHSATSGTLWAIAVLSLLVMALIAVESTFF